MNTIWKYQLTPETHLEIPLGGQILDIQLQHGEPQMWVLVDPKAEKEMRHFVIHGTGHTFDASNLEYIATFQMRGGSLVFHAFEVKEAR